MKTHPIPLPFTLFVTVILLAMLLVCLHYVYSFIFPLNDFAIFIRQNILMFWQGQNPYLGPGPYNPPWLYIFLVPLLWVPVPTGAAILTLLNLLSLSWLLFKSQASLPIFVMTLFSPVMFSLVMTSNVDGFLMLGALLPPQLGLFFVLAKPQLGLGIALYWAYDAYRNGGIRQLVKVLAPVSLSCLLLYMEFTCFEAHP